MKLELLKQMGKNKIGTNIYPRTEEQGKMLVKEGFAKEVEDDPIVEKELVLVNPEPGTYTTAWQTVGKKEDDTAAEPAVMTAKDLIEKVNAATTIEEVNALVQETETRKTVTDSATKKINELSKGS